MPAAFIKATWAAITAGSPESYGPKAGRSWLARAPLSGSVFYIVQCHPQRPLTALLSNQGITWTKTMGRGAQAGGSAAPSQAQDVRRRMPQRRMAEVDGYGSGRSTPNGETPGKSKHPRGL